MTHYKPPKSTSKDKKLKIIFGPTPNMIKVFVDDKKIGLIQKISFYADINVVQPVEIVFPDLLSIPSYTGNAVDSLKENLELLKDVPHVKVTLEKLTDKI